MPLEPRDQKELRDLAAEDRLRRRQAQDARNDLLAALSRAQKRATLRELADLTGFSFQWIAKLLAERS